MSNLYLRPLSVLREINVILREDLRDLDIVNLRRETRTSPSDPQTIAKWTQLLNMLAPSLVLLGKEFDNVVKRSNRQKEDQLNMIGIIYLFMSILMYTIIIILIYRLRDDQTIIAKINLIILIVIVFLVLTFVRKSIIILLEEDIRIICIAQQSTIHNALQYYKKELSDNEIVKKTAAKITGVGGDEFITAKEEKKQDESSCTSNDKTLPSVSDIIGTTCSSDRIKILDIIQQIKLEYERFDQYASWLTIKNMHGKLTEFFKKEGVSKQVNGSNITTIVHDEFANHFVPTMIELDMMIITPNLVQSFDRNLEFFRSKLAPFTISKEACESKAVAMRRASFDPSCAMCIFIRTYQDTSTPEGDLYKLNSLAPLEEFFMVTNNTIDIGSKVSVAIGKPIDGDPKRGGNIFVKGYLPETYIAENTKFKKVFLESSYNAAFSVGRTESDCNFIIPDNIQLFLKKYAWKTEEDMENIREEERTFDYIMNLFRTKVVGAGATTAFASLKLEDLYKYALLSGNTLRMLYDAREVLSTSLLDVTKKYEFQIDLQSQRKTIELYLAKIYGPTFESIRSTVMLILRDTNKKIQIALQSDLLQYTSEHALIKRASNMTEIEWTKRMRDIVNVIPKMREYRINFPKYNPVALKQITTTFTIYFVVCMVFLIILGFNTIITLFVNNVISTILDGIIAAILLSCVCIIVIIVLEIMMLKLRAVSNRKKVLLDTNGAELMIAVLRCVTSLVDMRKNATSLISNDNDRSKTDALLAIKYYHKSSENFDRCNFIDVHTTNVSIQSKVIIFVVLILFIVAVAIYVLNKLDPLGCYDNIKRIKSIIGLINSGDMDKTMTAEAFTSTTCLIPPTPPIWFLKVFATITIVMATTWFLSVNGSTNDDIINTLERLNDCREIDAYT